MKFTTRIWVIVLTSIVGLLIMGGMGLYSMRNSMIEDRKKEIAQHLNFANSQLKYFHNQEKLGFLTRAEAQAKAKEAIGAMRYGHDYFFVRSIPDNVMLVHPIESRVNKVSNGGIMKDGRTLVQMYKDEMAKSENGLAFVWGAAPHPEKVREGDRKLYPKLSGIKQFDPWQWWVGIGFFTEDINAFFLRQVSVFLGVAAVLIIAMAWLVIGMRNAILRQLGGEPESAVERMQHIANGDLAIDIPVAENDHESLMASLKLMQMKLNNISSAIQENAHSINDQVRSFDLMAKNYMQSRSDEHFNYLLEAVRKLERTVDVLGKSTSRIKLG